MNITRLPLLAGSLLLLGGCAYQPYPQLPTDRTVTTGPTVGASTSGSVAGAGGATAGAMERTLDSAVGSAANVSEVARREAAAAPVPQEVIPPPPDPDALPPAEQRRLDLLLGSQTFNYYEDGELIWSGLISSGAPEYPTPKGKFRVQSKDRHKRSGSYTNFFDQPTPMPYALQFSGPYWVHEGYVPNQPASHGCVRLRYEDAKFVYARIRIGDPINVID